jgi:exodeoxyribonuclease V alpha subunit
VVQLTKTWRFGRTIDQLAKAIRASDPDAVVEVLRTGASDVVFAEVDVEPVRPEGLEPLAEEVRRSGVTTREAAKVGDVPSALAALDRHRLLCAHRRGPFGVARWSSEVERWLSETEPGYADEGEWYLGRPLLVTANDYELGLFNGDTGVVVDSPDGVRVAFAGGPQPTLFAPVRLDAVQTVHAMTVHRAQGSQFDCVSFIVPPPDSPLLTRELLYTAVTRATRRVQVFGSEDAIRRAVLRPANRASGLRSRLG